MMKASFTEVFETRELTVDATTPRPHSSTTITGVAEDGTFEREKPVGMPGTDDPEATSKFVSINHQIDSDYQGVVEFVAHSDDVHFQVPSAKQIQTEQISEEFHLDNVEERTFVAVEDGEAVELTEEEVREHFGVDVEDDEDDDHDQEPTETADDGGELLADGGQVDLDDEWEERAEELHESGGIPKRRAKAAALRERGLVYREIAEELGDTSKASVSEMLSNVETDIEQAEWLVENKPDLSPGKSKALSRDAAFDALWDGKVLRVHQFVATDAEHRVVLDERGNQVMDKDRADLIYVGDSEHVDDPVTRHARFKKEDGEWTEVFDKEGGGGPIDAVIKNNTVHIDDSDDVPVDVVDEPRKSEQ